MSRRRLFSVKKELISKSREAALSAVEIFNNPNISFKAETFIVIMNISWTYLLHAYYRSNNVDYRYFKITNGRKHYVKTKRGAIKHWELETCLSDDKCPLDKDTKNNLFFLIGIRHEIEHQMTTNIDDLLSARFQACCLNYNEWIKNYSVQNMVLTNTYLSVFNFHLFQRNRENYLMIMKIYLPILEHLL